MFPRGGDREREAYGVERGVSRRLTNFRPCNEDEGFLISGMDEEFRVLGREKKEKKGERKEGTATNLSSRNPVLRLRNRWSWWPGLVCRDYFYTSSARKMELCISVARLILSRGVGSRF